VSGDAASSSHGGWAVEEFSPNHVTYIAQFSAIIDPGHIWSGFGFNSPNPQTDTDWVLSSENTFADAAGELIVPLPRSAMMGSIAITVLGIFKSRLGRLGLKELLI